MYVYNLGYTSSLIKLIKSHATTRSRKLRAIETTECKYLHCMISFKTQFKTWWWPSARAETCCLINKILHLFISCVFDSTTYTFLLYLTQWGCRNLRLAIRNFYLRCSVQTSCGAHWTPVRWVPRVKWPWSEAKVVAALRTHGAKPPFLIHPVGTMHHAGRWMHFISSATGSNCVKTA
jgi:hypothetical protein